jgi:ubiquinone/menaquinone biosynthesis C-methylase UbiE
MSRPEWQWNEMQQVGTDFSDIAEVRRYDQRMAEFRDVDAENRNLMGLLKLPAGSSILEIGCGTGRFSRFAAKAGMSVTAIDISSTMVDYVRQKAVEENLPGLRVLQAGFLTMDFTEGAFDAAVTGAALHHLPDAWKFVALRNIARVLKTDGQLLLGDVIFSTTGNDVPEDAFKRFVDGFKGMNKEAARHVATEFSTYDWIIEGLLTRAGFEQSVAANPSESFYIYHGRKK